MAANKTPLADCERQNSLLTTTQRKRINSNIKNTKQNRQTRGRIRERVRSGLRDFRLLADDLEKRDREKIFDEKPYSIDRYELSKDVAKAIQFMYVGLGGEGNFRGSLKMGVSMGELELKNVESSFNVIPKFEVERMEQTKSEKEILKAVQGGNLDSLESPDLYGFIKQARDADAIDFEQISEMIEFDEKVVPPHDEQPELEELLDAEVENRETMFKALKIGLEELAERGELPSKE
jgi:hypothetical protein